MNEHARQTTSKFLSLVLRHQPERIGLSLRPTGWVNVDDLLQACALYGHPISRAELLEVVAMCPKQRFAWSEDKRMIRANQGHSMPVELDLKDERPPKVLFHGTIPAALPSIKAKGLLRMKRHHVHLSTDKETAYKVGSRRGAAIVLTIHARTMWNVGLEFYKSSNGVWLTETVPSVYISGFPANSD